MNIYNICIYVIYSLPRILSSNRKGRWNTIWEERLCIPPHDPTCLLLINGCITPQTLGKGAKVAAYPLVVVSTWLKNLVVQWDCSPIFGVNIKHIWNHSGQHMVMFWLSCSPWLAFGFTASANSLKVSALKDRTWSPGGGNRCVYM